jgi:hypothetical protein
MHTMAQLRSLHWGLVIAALLAGNAALAKLPPPSDEAKAKSAEAAAKSAWSGKVEAYQLCQSQEAVAAGYYAAAKKDGKDVKPPVATPPCTDPGPFVYAPPAAPVAAVSAASGAKP